MRLWRDYSWKLEYCVLYLLREILNFQESQVKSFETHFTCPYNIYYKGGVENARTRDRKTLKSGCLSLLTIRSFGARDELGLSVRVWLGFGLGLPVRAIDSLTDTV
eukprot:sb/3477822/